MCPRNEELCPNYHPKDSIFGGMWGWGKFGIPQGEVFNGWVGWTSYRKLWLLLSNWGFPDVSGKCSPSSTNMYNCAMTIVLDALSNRMHIQLRDKVDVCVDENWKITAKIPDLRFNGSIKGKLLQEQYRFPPQKRNVLQISPWTSPGRAKTRPFWSRLKTIEVSRHVMYRNHRDVPFTEKTQVKYILCIYLYTCTYTYTYTYIYIYILYIYIDIDIDTRILIRSKLNT